MCLSHEHVGSKLPAKINTYMLTRAELHIHLCYEIPCMYFDAAVIFVANVSLLFRLALAILWRQYYGKTDHLLAKAQIL